MKPNPQSNAFRYRLSIAARTAAALGGGYAFASLWAALLALTLPLPREEAVIAGAMAAFVTYPAAAVWSFLASSARRAWIGLVLPGIAMSVAIWILRRGLT